MSLQDYIANRDNFVLDEDLMDLFPFPCRDCSHRIKNDTEEPCRSCDYNRNAVREKDEKTS